MENGNLFVRECECMNVRRYMKRARSSGLEDVIRKYTFKGYETPNEETRYIKSKALDYIDQGRGMWFFISGTPGSGKTHICTAICSALIKKGAIVKYVLWRDLAQQLKSQINEAEYQQSIEELRKPDVLYIDDFFRGSVTEADINRAYEVINARYNLHHKRTIISTNLKLEQITNYDKATGDRIRERSRGYRFHIDNINWRADE